jgi:outer membrane lipoprotein-sorting protein
VTLSNWAVDAELADDVFSFTIPEGVQPVTAEELRKTIQEEAAK